MTRYFHSSELNNILICKFGLDTDEDGHRRPIDGIKIEIDVAQFVQCSATIGIVVVSVEIVTEIESHWEIHATDVHVIESIDEADQEIEHQVHVQIKEKHRFHYAIDQTADIVKIAKIATDYIRREKKNENENAIDRDTVMAIERLKKKARSIRVNQNRKTSQRSNRV